MALLRAVILTVRNMEAPPIQCYLSTFPLNKNAGKLYNHLSISSLFNEGIPSLTLGQCFSSYSATSTTHEHNNNNNDDDDDDGHHYQIKHYRNIAAAAEPPIPLLEDALVQVIFEYGASDLGRLFSFSRVEGYRRRTANGFIIDIEGRRLLTSGHFIEHQSNISIQKHGSNTIYQAKVIATAHDFKLAMLTVSDDEFWEGVGSVELGDMPSLRDELTTMSYLEGMNTITSRSGFVSDGGMIQFFNAPLKLPTFVVNYDSKFGESGSAVFNENGKCVGMAIDTPESIFRGRVLPATIIKHFIQDYDRNGGYTGVPVFGVKWQKMENHALRIYTGMQHDQEGVLVIDKELGCPELEVLEPYDVILSIDGVKIANDGTVPFMRGRRINFNYLFTQKYTGDNVLVKVLRDSEIHEFSIKLATQKQSVPEDVKGRPDDYYIIGGLVLTSVKMLFDRGSDYYVEKYYGYVHDWLVSPTARVEYVMVSEVLEAEVNKGYSMTDIVNYQVLSLNNKPVKGLKELVSMVESCQSEYLVFGLRKDQIVVLPTNAAKETTPEILKTYGIPSAISDDLSNDLKAFRKKKKQRHE